MSNFIIRNERADDYRTVEELHRDAFWNLYVPGCNEHYLAHRLRTHEDFIPELDYVCELDGQVVANVMYTKSRLLDEQGKTTDILTFGPISVKSELQRRGIGKAMLEKSFEEAVKMGYPAIVIFGDPNNYVAWGFKSCKKYHVCLEGAVFPAAMLVKELKSGFFDGRTYFYQESPAFEIDEAAAEAFDQCFEKREKAWQPSQEAFYIHSHSVIR
ncbi:MAG: N-acetyltransferase [Eubacteriales bacterium]|nr:N-acetyltransferase [Eubacteriales bacterium]